MMIIGHQPILDFFKKSIANQRLAHAYLLTGSSSLGKKTIALEFIKILVGQVNHPDVLIIQPEIIEKNGIKKELEIGIKQARKIQHQMSLYPFKADYKIALIDQAEKLTSEASNCLLKTLEEPSGKAILILISSSPQKLLPTIISRCQLIKFLPVSDQELKKALPNASDQIIRLANGRPGLAIEYLENPELLGTKKQIIEQLEKLLRAGLSERYEYVETMAKNVPQARKILDDWLFWFRDLLLLDLGCHHLIIHSNISKYKKVYSLSHLRQIIQLIKKTNDLLANSSMNARLALEVLMLDL